jgi:hypothetical protein
MPHLPHERNRLQPAKAFLDPLPLVSLADGIPRVPRRAAINRTALAPPQVRRHVRHDLEISALGHKPERVKTFVSSNRQRLRTGKLLQHRQRRISLRRAVGHVDDQSVAVLHQQIPSIAQLGFLPLAFARQWSVGIGLRLMSLIRPSLAAKVYRGIAGIGGLGECQPSRSSSYCSQKRSNSNGSSDSSGRRKSPARGNRMSLFAANAR